MSQDFPQFTGLDLELLEADKVKLLSTMQPAASWIQYGANELTNVPDVLDIRPFHTLEDQSRQGSCQGQANTSLAEFSYWLESDGALEPNGKMIQFSRQFCYIESQRKDNLVGRDVGSTISGGFEMAKDGHCLEKYFPYPTRSTEDPKSLYTSRVPAECYEHRDFKITKGTYTHTTDEMWLHQAGGLGGHLLGMLWPDCMQNHGTAPNGEPMIVDFYEGGRGAGRHAAGHAVTIIGWVIIDGKRYWRLFNSWGVGQWSKDGTVLVPDFVMQKILAHRMTVCVAFSGISGVEKPTPKDWSYIANGGYYG